MVLLRGLMLTVFLRLGITASASLVRTKQGYVRGLRQQFDAKSEDNVDTVYKFLGVPYAEPPVKNLRFNGPIPPRSWAPSIYEATEFKDICTQSYRHYGGSINNAWPTFTEKRFSEDCLYLNIYTPSINPDGTHYPVIFYIHGGGFFAGTPIRDVTPGEFLPLRGIVLVTVQYRLGIFGFLTTGDAEAPGNAGLLDQVEALQWTKRNIFNFGGEPNNITIMGESAGGASVGLHLMSPLSKGLFQRAIAVSGVEFSPFALLPNDVVVNYVKKTVAEELECNFDSSSAMLECLREMPSSKLEPYFNLVKPIIDGFFLPDDPHRLREQGDFHRVPLLSGFVSHEGSFLLENARVKYTMEGMRNFAQHFLRMEFYSNSMPDKVSLDALLFQYTPWLDKKDSNKIRKKMIEMLSDSFVIAPTHASLTLHSKHGAPTYMFEFTHRSRRHKKPAWMGVVHGDTTAYKFGVPLLSAQQHIYDEQDRNVSDMLVTMFVNFAKYGNPTPSPVHGTNWERFNTSNKAYLKIQPNVVLASKFHPARMAFWNEYFPGLVSRQKLDIRVSESRSGSEGLSGLLWGALLASLAGMLSTLRPG
ncbi:cholinesterase 1 [Nematostella vectensis]|uniref:cholinesterase 1 n=1 Tax=Nematostella vectensis TaxID=45351 RepID=UPI0020774A2F|nr:cholinesterase 1 [Nematostella vectensis]